MKSLKCISAALAVLALQASPASAHHSYAGFDMATTKTVSGTLVRFDFSAPHARVVLTHINEKGEAEEFQIMTGSPTQLLRRGFDPRQFHKGDKVEVTYHPNRNGALGGQLEKMVMADGRELIDPSADERRALLPSPPADQAHQANQKKDN